MLCTQSATFAMKFVETTNSLMLASVDQVCLCLAQQYCPNITKQDQQSVFLALQAEQTVQPINSQQGRIVVQRFWDDY